MRSVPFRDVSIRTTDGGSRRNLPRAYRGWILPGQWTKVALSQHEIQRLRDVGWTPDLFDQVHRTSVVPPPTDMPPPGRWFDRDTFAIGQLRRDEAVRTKDYVGEYRSDESDEEDGGGLGEEATSRTDGREDSRDSGRPTDPDDDGRSRTVETDDSDMAARRRPRDVSTPTSSMPPSPLPLRRRLRGRTGVPVKETSGRRTRIRSRVVPRSAQGQRDPSDSSSPPPPPPPPAAEKSSNLGVESSDPSVPIESIVIPDSEEDRDALLSN